MGSNSKINSFSSTSMELLDEDAFDDISEPSTSNASKSIHPGSTVTNLLLPRHSHFTRLAAKRFKTAGKPYPYEYSTDSNKSISSLRCTIEPTPGYSRINSSFLSRSNSSIRQDPNRRLQDWDTSCNDLPVTRFLPRENLRALDMDFPACGRNRINVYSIAWKIGLAVASLCFIGFIVWYVIQYFNSISADLRCIKKQMDRMKVGGGSVKSIRDTRQKLGMIENLVHGIKKSQQGSCLADGRKDALSRKVLTLVQQALDKYSADKTGRTDFALESTGGSIVGIYDTEPYDPSSSATVFGIPVCPGVNGPQSVIQANVQPGECWAFKGNSGSVVIKLLAHVYIDGVSLEHISKTISPSGDIDSAPKDFTIWGLDNGTPGEGEHLGNFRFDAAGETIQYFSIDCSSTSFLYIHFSVFSNHGNPTFTCVYRLRVHGTVDNNVGD